MPKTIANYCPNYDFKVFKSCNRSAFSVRREIDIIKEGLNGENFFKYMNLCYAMLKNSSFSDGKIYDISSYNSDDEYEFSCISDGQYIVFENKKLDKQVANSKGFFAHILGRAISEALKTCDIDVVNSAKQIFCSGLNQASCKALNNFLKIIIKLNKNNDEKEKYDYDILGFCFFNIFLNNPKQAIEFMLNSRLFDLHTLTYFRSFMELVLSLHISGKYKNNVDDNVFKKCAYEDDLLTVENTLALIHKSERIKKIYDLFDTNLTEASTRYEFVYETAIKRIFETACFSALDLVNTDIYNEYNVKDYCRVDKSELLGKFFVAGELESCKELHSFGPKNKNTILYVNTNTNVPFLCVLLGEKPSEKNGYVDSRKCVKNAGTYTHPKMRVIVHNDYDVSDFSQIKICARLKNFSIYEINENDYDDLRQLIFSQEVKMFDDLVYNTKSKSQLDKASKLDKTLAKASSLKLTDDRLTDDNIQRLLKTQSKSDFFIWPENISTMVEYNKEVLENVIEKVEKVRKKVTSTRAFYYFRVAQELASEAVSMLPFSSYFSEEVKENDEESDDKLGNELFGFHVLPSKYLKRHYQSFPEMQKHKKMLSFDYYESGDEDGVLSTLAKKIKKRKKENISRYSDSALTTNDDLLSSDESEFSDESEYDIPDSKQNKESKSSSVKTRKHSKQKILMDLDNVDGNNHSALASDTKSTKFKKPSVLRFKPIKPKKLESTQHMRPVPLVSSVPQYNNSHYNQQFRPQQQTLEAPKLDVHFSREELSTIQESQENPLEETLQTSYI